MKTIDNQKYSVEEFEGFNLMVWIEATTTTGEYVKKGIFTTETDKGKAEEVVRRSKAIKSFDVVKVSTKEELDAEYEFMVGWLENN